MALAGVIGLALVVCAVGAYGADIPPNNVWLADISLAGECKTEIIDYCIHVLTVRNESRSFTQKCTY